MISKERNMIVNQDSDEKNWSSVKALTSETDLLQLGSYSSYTIQSDIKHLAFTLSRYKFVSKMLNYKKKVDILELGCNEALGALLFQQNIELNQYVGIDLDKDAINWNKKNLPNEFKFICSNFFNCEEIKEMNFDAVVSLDVIEHISPVKEEEYCCLIVECLKSDGVAIIGTPNIAMSPYASEGGRLTHINLYDQKRLYEAMNKYFHNVFIFNMNDEVVNTSFAPMSCYIFALCCNKK